MALLDYKRNYQNLWETISISFHKNNKNRPNGALTPLKRSVYIAIYMGSFTREGEVCSGSCSGTLITQHWIQIIRWNPSHFIIVLRWPPAIGVLTEDLYHFIFSEDHFVIGLASFVRYNGVELAVGQSNFSPGVVGNFGFGSLHCRRSHSRRAKWLRRGKGRGWKTGRGRGRGGEGNEGSLFPPPPAPAPPPPQLFARIDEFFRAGTRAVQATALVEWLIQMSISPWREPNA